MNIDKMNKNTRINMYNIERMNENTGMNMERMN